ncbi:hypothetical protein ACFQ3B_02250 [Stackebrandtia endophytica]|uniref:hypothetical protein n=1 Tax=Stackebrandtia endophytica TaxID=1496996 RepID=UPI00114E133B|nr:hypothetical protein [Stackebrandtia endophytica]
MDDFLVVLREEFEAVEGSFMLALRGKSLVWDRAGFTRLERAMRRACEWSQERDRFDRWMAEGFYDASRFVRDWTSHPNFPRPQPQQYHLDCLDRIDDLADWFFRGFHSYQEPHTWPDL